MKDTIAYYRLLKNLSAFEEVDQERTILLTTEDKNDFYASSVIIYNRDEKLQRGYDTPISLELLRYVIDNYMDVLENVYSDTCFPTIELVTIDEDGYTDSLPEIAKADLIRKIEIAYALGLISDEQYQKTTIIRQKASYEELLNDCEEETMHYKCYSGEYEINIKTCFDILSLPKEELLWQLETGYLADIPAPEFLAILESIMKMSQLSEKYVIPIALLNNKILLESKIDSYAASQTFYQLPEFTSKIQIASSIIDKVMTDIPEEFNQLEKAYYIYNKLCEMFTYDEEYLATSGTALNVQKHRDINYIKNLTLENNELVCHEFNAIYSKLLERIGVKYKYPAIEKYGVGHAFLILVTNNCCVKVDPLTSILFGDMAKKKIGEPLTGFCLKNTHPTTIEAFKNSLAKVDDYVFSKRKQENDYAEVLAEYKSNFADIERIPLDVRKSIFLDLISSCTLPVTDSLAYILTLEKNIFPATKEKNCRSFFVADYKPSLPSKSASVAVIICYNKNESIDSLNAVNEYYLYNPRCGLTEISLTDLSLEIDSGRYKLISNYEKTIPGLRMSGSEKKGSNR